MVSIRKTKKLHKCGDRKVFNKRFKTVEKSSEYRTYEWHHRTFKYTSFIFNMSIKSKRKRGKNKSNGGSRLSK